ncbi:NnrU family protein [Vibrio sp.]|uniref:NnrU family protein n=1 Tax=Vibrio sp. TaxID=678 RepID=UPI003D0A9AE9
MLYLLLGLLLWSVVHLFPSVSVAGKASIVSRYGELAYKGVFSVLILLSLILIVVGWRSSIPTLLYVLPEFGRLLTLILMIFAFVLFVASKLPTNIKQLIRHPQLASVIVWAVAHLLANGDSRSVLLFGGLGVWAAVEMVLINKREGQWVKPERAGWFQDAICLVVGIVVFAVVIFLHPYLSGVSLR